MVELREACRVEWWVASLAVRSAVLSEAYPAEPSAEQEQAPKEQDQAAM